MEWLSDPNIWASLATLTALEIVLGIDNLVFLSIVTEKLPPERQPAARRIGLALALAMRVALLSVVVWIAGLVAPVFSIGEHAVSWRDMILLLIGTALIADGLHFHIERGFIYAAIVFSVLVEVLNLAARRKRP